MLNQNYITHSYQKSSPTPTPIGDYNLKQPDNTVISSIGKGCDTDAKTAMPVSETDGDGH